MTDAELKKDKKEKKTKKRKLEKEEDEVEQEEVGVTETLVEKKKKKRKLDDGEENGGAEMEVEAQEGEKKKKKKKKASADTEDQVEATNAPTTPSRNGREKEKVDYEVRVQAVSEFAKPLADKKLTKKMLKAVKEASKQKAVKRGVKEVVKALRKGQKGFVIIAGDISPIDVITHIPVLCEDNDVPYIYLPSKEDLGHAGSTRRPTSCIMIMEKAGSASSDMSESYRELFDELQRLNEKLISTV